MGTIEPLTIYRNKMKEDDICSHIDNITEELIEYIRSYELKEYGNEVPESHFLKEMRVCILGAIRYKCQVETNNGTHKEMIDYLNNKGRTEFLNKVDDIYINLKMSYFDSFA